MDNKETIVLVSIIIAVIFLGPLSDTSITGLATKPVETFNHGCYMTTPAYKSIPRSFYSPNVSQTNPVYQKLKAIAERELTFKYHPGITKVPDKACSSIMENWKYRGPELISEFSPYIKGCYATDVYSQNERGPELLVPKDKCPEKPSETASIKQKLSMSASSDVGTRVTQDLSFSSPATEFLVVLTSDVETNYVTLTTPSPVSTPTFFMEVVSVTGSGTIKVGLGSGTQTLAQKDTYMKGNSVKAAVVAFVSGGGGVQQPVLKVTGVAVDPTSSMVSIYENKIAFTAPDNTLGVYDISAGSANYYPNVVLGPSNWETVSVPVIWKNIVAFRHSINMYPDQDFPRYDNKLAYIDLSTGQVTVTLFGGSGASLSPEGVYENIITASYTPVMVAYDTVTKTGIGGHPFGCLPDPESPFIGCAVGIGTSINGDYIAYTGLLGFFTGNLQDMDLEVYSISQGKKIVDSKKPLVFANPNLVYGASSFRTMWGNIAGFTDIFEIFAQSDLNGDGAITQYGGYYDISTNNFNYLADGSGALVSGVYGNKIVYVKPSVFGGGGLLGVRFPIGGDDVIRLYDISSGASTSLNQITSSPPAIYGNVIAFTIYEQVAGQDLNSDGDMEDFVLATLTI